MQNHTFYLALAYGVSGILLLAEVVALYRRWCKANAVCDERSGR
ncbi:hypothetical protein [Comamonas sp.]